MNLSTAPERLLLSVTGINFTTKSPSLDLITIILKFRCRFLLSHFYFYTKKKIQFLLFAFAFFSPKISECALNDKKKS